MSTSIALRSFERPVTPSGSRAWRPVPDESEPSVLCLEESGGALAPRIHARFAATILHAPAVVRVESSRSIFTEQEAILLLPPWRLHAVRAPAAGGGGAVTLLFGLHCTEGLNIADGPAVVTDPQLVGEVAALVAQWRRPVRPACDASSARSRRVRLAALGAPVAAARVRRATPLAPMRDRLRAALDEQVPTAELAQLSGLTEWHLIRAFHREFGLPPHAYHLRLRLAAACELLSSGVCVSTVAYECGFADQSHLSRKFREVYGLTPAAWGRSASGEMRRAWPGDPRPAARGEIGVALSLRR